MTDKKTTPKKSKDVEPEVEVTEVEEAPFVPVSADVVALNERMGYPIGETPEAS